MTVFGEKMQAFFWSELQIAPIYSIFEGVSKYSCMTRSLVSSDRWSFPIPFPSSIGFTVVKNTACLPLLRLFPPGIDPFLIRNSIHSRSRRGRCTRQILSEIVPCLAMLDQWHYLLNVLDLLEGTGIDWKSSDSRKYSV